MYHLHTYEFATKVAKFWNGTGFETVEYPLGAKDVDEWPPTGAAVYDKIPVPIEPEPEPEPAKKEAKAKAEKEVK